MAVDALVRQPVRGPRVGDAAVLLGALEQLAALEGRAPRHRLASSTRRRSGPSALGEDAVGLGQRRGRHGHSPPVSLMHPPGPGRCVRDARHRVAVERADAAERPVPPERGRVRGPPVRAEHRVPGAGEAAAVRAAGVTPASFTHDVTTGRQASWASAVAGARRAGEREDEQAAGSMHVLATGRAPGTFPAAALRADELLVGDAVRAVGLGAQALAPVLLVGLEVALEPRHLRVALEGEARPWRRDPGTSDRGR